MHQMAQLRAAWGNMAALVGRQDTIREQGGVRSGMKRGAGRRERAPLVVPRIRLFRFTFIRPGKVIENAHSKSFNGKPRDECLNENWFVTQVRPRSERMCAL
jgi:hypothetical protein